MTMDWRTEIIRALGSGSEQDMKQVYSSLISALGPDVGGRLWLEVVSGWDSSAITG